MRFCSTPARLGLGLWALSLATGCGAQVTPVTDASMDSAVISQPDGISPDAQREASVSRDASAGCITPEVRELRAPSVSRVGSDVNIAVVSVGTGCNCTVNLRTLSATTVAIEHCGCEVSCIDPDTISPHTLRGLVLDPREAPIELRAMAQTVAHTVIPADRRCIELPSAIRSVVVSDDRGRRTSRPREVWIKVEAQIARCSGRAFPLVTSALRGELINVSVSDCNNTDCDGPTRLETYSVWHSLGVLAAGSHALFFAPESIVPFTVR
ncbi:MAG: hypothetical protein Q8Q09_06980 [Deltaproteobacteria bacterium]|nr:hypothetical protein [Deltaproteobacteria bacterium]